MISPSGNFKIYVAAQPVDFRKGMDGLAAIVQSEFNLDLFSGAIFVFRARRADRLKIVVWDGTGLVLAHKRIEGAGFAWPKTRDGVISLSLSKTARRLIAATGISSRASNVSVKSSV